MNEKLADQESIEVLQGILKYLETKNLNDIAKICTDEEQYFIPEVYQSTKRKTTIMGKIIPYETANSVDVYLLMNL